MMERDEQKLRGYFLGDLPEAAQLKIETEFLNSDEAFERLEEIENDLVDEYVHGDLSASERILFEQNYLTTPSHRQRVLLSQNLKRAATAEKKLEKNKAAAPAATSWWMNLFSGLTIRQFAWAMAALFITVLGGWFLLIPQSPTIKNPEIAKVDPTPQPAAPTPDPKPSRSESSKPETQNPKPNLPTPDTRHPTPVFLLRGAFDLNQTRSLGTGKKPINSAKTTIVAIKKNVEKITLQLPLEAERYNKYQADIQLVDSKNFFTIKTNSSSKTAKNLSLSFPANRLNPADYILILSGVNEAGELEEINQYPFRVNRQ
jgi:hypothetical protein